MATWHHTEMSRDIKLKICREGNHSEAVHLICRFELLFTFLPSRCHQRGLCWQAWRNEPFYKLHKASFGIIAAVASLVPASCSLSLQLWVLSPCLFLYLLLLLPSFVFFFFCLMADAKHLLDALLPPSRSANGLQSTPPPLYSF